MTKHENLRKYIRSLLIEAEKKTLGEPDVTAEKLRDDPQPQYEEEDDGYKDTDEASTVGGMGSGLGPNMPLAYDPEKPIYDPYKKSKKKK